MTQLSSILLSDWATKRLNRVGLTPDDDAELKVREDEEWEEGCDCCGPCPFYELTIVVNGVDVLGLDGSLDDFIDEILADVPESDHEQARLEVERHVRG